jgi:hypothetical protein
MVRFIWHDLIVCRIKRSPLNSGESLSYSSTTHLPYKTKQWNNYFKQGEFDVIGPKTGITAD